MNEEGYKGKWLRLNLAAKNAQKYKKFGLLFWCCEHYQWRVSVCEGMVCEGRQGVRLCNRVSLKREEHIWLLSLKGWRRKGRDKSGILRFFCILWNKRLVLIVVFQVACIWRYRILIYYARKEWLPHLIARFNADN